MKLDVEGLLNLHSAVNMCEELKKLKSAGTWKFGFLLVEIMKLIKGKSAEYKEKIDIMNEDITNLRLKYCTKDSENKPIIIKSIDRNGNQIEMYTGLVRGQQPEFDKLTDEIKNKSKELLKEKVEIELEKIPKIKEDDIHLEISEYAFIQLGLYDLIERNK